MNTFFTRGKNTEVKTVYANSFQLKSFFWINIKYTIKILNQKLVCFTLQTRAAKFKAGFRHCSFFMLQYHFFIIIHKKCIMGGGVGMYLGECLFPNFCFTYYYEKQYCCFHRLISSASNACYSEITFEIRSNKFVRASVHQMYV